MTPASRLTRLRWWLDNRSNGTVGYHVWSIGNWLLCLTTGHDEVENVNVRSKWDTHCAWCQTGMAPRLRRAS